MKTVLLFLLLALSQSACSHQKSILSSDEQSLRNLHEKMSDEEKEIQYCLENASKFASINEISLKESEKICLSGSYYESLKTRMPSTSSEAFIEKNAWLFQSPSMIDSLIQFIEGIQKTSEALRLKMNSNLNQSLESKGVGFYGEAVFGIGKSWLGELVVHQNKIGLFCAPGSYLKTDVGFAFGFESSQTLSCESNQHYAGGFLSFETGLSSEMFLLPFELGVAYSFGIDGKTFREDLKKINLSSLQKELFQFSQLLKHSSLKNNIGSSTLVSLDFLNKMVSSLNGNQKTFTHLFSTDLDKNKLLKQQSIGHIIKKWVATKKLEPFFKKNHFDQLDLFTKIFAKSLTGCDGVGGSGSIGLSVMPVSLGVKYSEYGLLMEMPVSFLNVMERINPFSLMNPKLMSYSDLKAIVELAHSVVNLRENFNELCTHQKAF